jgi:hypothetical protein
MYRNLRNCGFTAAIINLYFPQVSKCLDYGAGHGIFVRLMRDRGFDFAWLDRYASNDYARGFEHKESETYKFLTAFELLEHLVDPMPEIAEIMDLSENLLVTTSLVPQGISGIADWWYFVPNTGQHVSFYTRRALELVAARFGRHLLSSGDYHLFTREPQPAWRFRLATKHSRIVNKMHQRQSLRDADFAILNR